MSLRAMPLLLSITSHVQCRSSETGRASIALLAVTLVAGFHPQSARAEFVHPGVAHSREKIEFVRKKIEAGDEPWSAAWDKLRASPSASLEWRPNPHAHVERGPSNNPNIGSSDFSRDAVAAYTQQGQVDGLRDNRDNTLNRFWRHAEASSRAPGSWAAPLPLVSTDKPLWVYANVTYALSPPVAGAGYYYGSYTAGDYVISSRLSMLTPKELRAAGVKPTLEPSRLIETFEAGWEKEWYSYKPDEWARRTHKVYDERFKAPANGWLAFEARVAEPNQLVVGIDQFAVERQIPGGGEWTTIELEYGEFLDAGSEPLSGWEGIKELRLAAKETLRSGGRGKQQRRTLGADWDGEQPEFRNLRWMAN